MRFLFSILLMTMLMTGCAAQTTTMVTRPVSEVEENTRVIRGNIDDVWKSAISALSKDFFVLDNIEKDSRIITLSYSGDDPTEYIDCGMMTVINKGGVNSGEVTFPYAQKYATYLIGNDGTGVPKPAKRGTFLSGKMNIVIVEESNNKVKISVNTVYRLDIKLTGQRYITTGGFKGFTQDFNDSDSITFHTSQKGSKSNGRCISKNTLEKSVIDRIVNELKSK